MTATALATYDPQTFRARTFYDATPRFRDGTDTPRAYFERCLETMAAREPVVQAFAALNEAGARAVLASATARWLLGTVSPVVVR
jgi:phosphoserine phosphatase